MKKSDLEEAVLKIKNSVHDCVTTKYYNGRLYPTGWAAKDALVKSSTLIQVIHEAVKNGLHDELRQRKIEHVIHPPLGVHTPESNVWGLLKKKRQDVVVLIGNAKPTPELIEEGPLMGQQDLLGRAATKQAIVIGVRSQLSSVDNNFDTLMERALAETLNLRLRHPHLVMGEVFLLAVKEYDHRKMRANQVEWNNKFTNVERFISIFEGLSGREDHQEMKQAYKYERSALLLVDFSLKTPKIYWTLDELRADKIVSDDFTRDYTKLSPLNFSKDLLDSYVSRHADQKQTTSSTSQ
jgi:hypothetical protein